MKARVGIVLVHGIVGNNRIFDFLLPLIPEDCRVKFVVLEGHGGNALAFSRASMNGWKRQVEDAVSDMARHCSKVLAVGHSMGCLLLLEEAFKGNLAALFLLNPPLKLRIRSRLVSNSFKVALGKTDKDEVAKAAEEAYGISLDFNLLHYYGWPKRYLELFAEIRRVRRLLGRGVPAPVYAVLSEKDEMVSVSTAAVLKDASIAKVTVIPGSHHFHYTAADRKIVCKEFSEFLSSII